MNINIELQRKPEDYRLDNCVIDVVEEIPHESFETFQNYQTARYGAITNSLHRLPEDTKNERHCILLLDADGNDGFLVNPHGADYAKYSAFVPNARQILQLQSPSLEEFAGRMCRMVERFTAQALQKQENGTYTLDLDEVDRFLTSHSIQHCGFYEPDLYGMRTAICFLANDYIFDTKTYPKYEDMQSIMAFTDFLDTIYEGFSVNEYAEIMEIRDFIFSKKLSM